MRYKTRNRAKYWRTRCSLSLLALAFVPVILFVRDELLWCGVGVTATLIVGAFVVNWKNRRSGEGDQ